MSSSHAMPNSSNDHHHQQQEFRYPHTPSTPKSIPYIHDLGKPNLTLKVPVNVNKILIADIDRDDLNELILARTDRILHAFQLVPAEVSQEHMYKGIQTPSIASLSPSGSTTSLNGLATTSAASTSAILTTQHQQQKRPSLATAAATAAAAAVASVAGSVSAPIVPTLKEEASHSKKINLLDKNMWVFDGQISSLCTTTHPERPNEPLLLVAQPGNTFTIIDQDGKRYNKDFTPQQRTTTTTTTTTTERRSEDENKIKDLLLKNKRQEETIEICQDESIDKNADFKRSNYVVKNWPVLDTGGNHDDVIDEDIESGAVATEIVMGKRHLIGESSSEVGMLSMDGKFSIYDLRTKTTSQRDLFVTHKLFSLATLDVSSSINVPPPPPPIEEKKKKYYDPIETGTHTPMSGSSNLRYAATPRKTSSLNESSRNSSKLSLNALVNPTTKEDEDIINKKSSEGSVYTSEDEGDGDDSDYESVPWSEGSESDEGPGCDLFVACAWNGVTYLIDWSKRIGDEEEEDSWATESDDSSSSTSSSASTEKASSFHETSKIKYQLVKFAFEGRVCAFTAGLYSVENHVNVPCLFYVDFEDQIYVYYDVRISPGPVTGFIDSIDDDVEEALDRIIGIESGIEALLESNHGPRKKKLAQEEADDDNEEDDTAAVDLGDGWQGIADDDYEDEDDGISHVPLSIDQQQKKDKLEDSDPISKLEFYFFITVN